jgi:hypothetical protein
MATGAPGTNGVWQYGEDDSETTFSALLNKAASTTDTQLGLDRARLTTLEARRLSALSPVVPSSVVVSSGSGSFNSTTGLVTFTGATSISVNGCFTSTYTNYRVILHQMRSNTSNTAVKFRLRSAGTDYTTNQYYTNGIVQTGTAAMTQYFVMNGTWLDFGAQPSSGSDNYGFFSFDISSPQVTGTMKTVTGSGYGFQASTAAFHVSGLVGVTSSYDGFTIFTNSAATFNGKISVMGYNQ